MNELFRVFFGLHKRTKFFAILISIAMFFPAMFVIVFVYFEEFMKYNLLNIILLAAVINICCFIWIFILSTGVMELLKSIEQVFLYIKQKTTKKIPNGVNKIPDEILEKANIESIDRDLVNTSLVIIIIGILISMQYSDYNIAPLTFNAKNLIAIFFDDITIGAVVVGFMNYFGRRKLYFELMKDGNEIISNNSYDN